ncbi:sulfite oxidase [Purpureocillium lavendulum]|uniref:Sulfite oxidase n=1 Tax=Purpureocillium lavendulum TaxID=1247861 RepID=A0AB34FFK7_9HYPO|nr:sulfite oxidase [Purpureocillium lavendulum]
MCAALISDPEKVAQGSNGSLEGIDTGELEDAAAAAIELQTKVDDKKLLRRLDMRVIPPIFALFFMSFMDRGNIGNAKIQGMEKTLGMKGQDYSVALFVFFVPYILCEVPSNLLLKKLSPSTWLSFIITGWGIVTIGQGLVKNFGGLVGLRVALGFFESGLFPGGTYLMSAYYARYELQWRFTLFFSSIIIAGAFGGLFAFALAKLDGVQNLEGWRWIFIIEGIITVAIGIIAKFWIVDWPEQAKFLSPDEKAHLARKLAADAGGGSVARMDRLDKAAVRRILKDWKIYMGIFLASDAGATNDKDAVSIDADVMTGMVGDPSRSVEFFGRSSAGSFLRQINSAIDAQLGQSHTIASRDLDGVSPLRRASHVECQKKDPRDFVLPQRQTADNLLQSYYDYVWAVLPVSDWNAFKRDYTAIWTGLLPGIPEATFYCMLNMAFALGSQFSLSIEPDQRQDVGKSFSERARKLFGPHTHDSASIERVQCMLLMGLYLQSTCDTVLSMTFGRPSMIASCLPETVHVPAPSMIDDDYLDRGVEPQAIRPDGRPCIVAFFVKTIELYDIINDILLQLYQSSSDVASKDTHLLVAVLRFDDRLRKWAQSLPDHLQYSQPEKDHSLLFERQRIRPPSSYLQARIVVLRPVLAEYYLKLFNLKKSRASNDDSLSHHLVIKSAELCFQAAHEMIDVLYHRFDIITVTGPVPAWWFAVLFVYTAATVLLAERLRPIDERAGVSCSWHGGRSWDQAIELLKAYSRVGKSAERCVAALGILSSKIPSTARFSLVHGESGPRQDDTDICGVGGMATNAIASQECVVGSDVHLFDLGTIDFDIDDMFWLNTSAADIIF